MAYISAKEVDDIRKALKAEFPNLKFSVTRNSYHGIIVIIKSGNLDIAYLLAGKLTLTRQFIREMESGIIKDTLTRIYDIVTKDQKYEETSDYGFRPNYYESIRIGQYNMPYILKS